MKLMTFYPVYIRDFGVGHACGSILEAMNLAGASVELHCITTDSWSRRSFHRYALSPPIKRLGYRFFGADYYKQLAARKYIKALIPGDIAYLWPGTPLEVFREVKKMGNCIVTEFINTHCATGMRIVRNEQIANNIEPFSLSQIRREANKDNLRIALSDFIFSPSPEVTKSLRRAGTPEAKIIESSYGLRSSDILQNDNITAKVTGARPVALFVGRVGVRKGAHLLLDYWCQADLDATLKVVGGIEEEAIAVIERYTAQDNIDFHGFEDDLLPLYQDADVFLFPTLEEGSPLVTYLALGAGLASIVSPMGSGGAINDGVEGKVIDPHNRDGWIKELKNFIGNAETRRVYSANASRRAGELVWSAVGRQRFAELSNRIAESVHQ